MKPAFFGPASLLEKKPPHGQPCTSCGLCCVATLCPLARHVFGGELGPCPALEWEGEDSRCGLVVHPMVYSMSVTLNHGVAAASEAALMLIGSGTGCDARFNGEPADHAFYGALRDHDRRNASRINRARRVWRF